jgi:Na+/H+ antiporter NhaC
LTPALRRLFAFFPWILGVSLTAALLVPQPHPDRLVAAVLARLLTQDYERAFGEDRGTIDSGTLFRALDAAIASGEATAVGLQIERPTVGGDWDREAFRRAVASSFNLYNAHRRELGAAPVSLASPAEPGAIELGLVLAESGYTFTLEARISDAPALWIGAEEGWRLPGRGALLPPLVAIAVGLIWGRPLLALFVGIWVGAVGVAMARGLSVAGAVGWGLVDVFGVYLRNEVVSSFRIEIIGFVVALLAMVGVMSRCGGVEAMVDALRRYADSVRSTLAATFGMGLLLFFDDYANCVLVGSTMRPLTDRMRISREKLAYIVDSTAAPVAGISVLSTWVAVEVSTYSAQLPGVGITENAYAIFLQTIPFRFYCLFTLAFVGLLIATGRDFGPMGAAERRARVTGALVRPGGTPVVSEDLTRIEPSGAVPPDWRKGAYPLIAVVAVTMLEIFRVGGGFGVLAETPGALLSLEGIAPILFKGSGAGPIFVGALVGLLVATCLAGSNVVRIALAGGIVVSFALKARLEAVLASSVTPDLVGYAAVGVGLAATSILVAALLRWGGMRTPRPHLVWGEMSRSAVLSTRSLGFAIVLLFEAWMIGAVCQDLNTADYLSALVSGAVAPTLLPTLLFTVAGLVAFSTGSSWSTMGILLPNVVGLSAAIGMEHPIGSVGMVIVCIGAVLEGSILGDHCSPISDTTVLSSVSSASDHIDHVRTQAPYALLTAAAAVVLGYIPTLLFDWWSFWLAMASGLGAMTLVLLLVGGTTPEPESASS